MSKQVSYRQGGAVELKQGAAELLPWSLMLDSEFSLLEQCSALLFAILDDSLFTFVSKTLD